MKDPDIYNSEYAGIAKVERFEKLKEMLADFQCEGKSVLEIGAGHGDNIHLFRDCGFRDNDIFVNEMLKERISGIRINFPTIKVYEGNVFELNFERKFDVVFQSTVFTSILSDQDRKALAKKMWSLLKPGGRILWYDFIYNNPKNAQVKKVTAKEAQALFPDAVSYKISKVTLAPPIGRRVSKMYRLFNFPFLRSHIVAMFQKK